MSEKASLFIIENIEKSYEIANALVDVDDYFWPKVDGAIRDIFQQNFDNDWIFSENDSLNAGEYISIAHKDLWFINDKQANDARIWINFCAEGDDALWDFFGMPTGSEKFIGLSLSMDAIKMLPDYESKIEQVVSLIDSPLKKAGFTVKGKIPYYKFPLTFNNAEVVEALKEDNWENVLKPITESIKIFTGLNWQKIIEIIQKK
jgi:hypothetical protein